MVNEFKPISTEEMKAVIGDKNAKIIDVRPIDAYNGWKLCGEARGGHITGAKSLPVKWIEDIDWADIVEAKAILPQHNIVIYGYNNDEIESAAQKFADTGYAKIRLYNRFEQWAADGDLPMEHLARYKNLVPPVWVNDLINNKLPESKKKYVVVHAHYRNRNAYLSGHIPGAVDMDTLALEAPETWNRRSPQELKAALEAHGITADTLVVLYGKYMEPDNADEFPGSAAGHIGAIRCAFIMMYAGVKDVRVLNGGYTSWEDAGYAISAEDVKKQRVVDFGAHIPARPELAVDIEEAKEMLKSEDAELVCVRSWAEYIGEVSGYNYIKKKGRIPGAVFGNCGSDAYHMENYRNWDHTTREYHEIAEQWQKVGLTPDKHLAFYCGTGWRGSEAFFNAWLMGWPRVSVFDGGWFEWSNDPNNPYETGIPE